MFRLGKKEGVFHKFALQFRRDEIAVEHAAMVGNNDTRLLRQFDTAVFLQIVKRVHHHFDTAAAKRLNKPCARNHYPTHFAGQNLFPRYVGAGRDVLLILLDVGTQLGQRAQVVQLRFVHADAKRRLDKCQQCHFTQRIHRQIDFKIVVGAGITFQFLIDVSL